MTMLGGADFKDEDINPKNKDMLTPLHSAAHKGHLKICKLIINQVRDKNPRDIDGHTPLHVAAHEGHLEVCRLISSLAETNNLKSNEGASPLAYAVNRGHLEVTKFFLDLVENKNPTEKDFSLLHLAAFKGHFKVFQHIFDQVWSQTCKFILFTFQNGEFGGVWFFYFTDFTILKLARSQVK